MEQQLIDFLTGDGMRTDNVYTADFGAHLMSQLMNNLAHDDASNADEDKFQDMVARGYSSSHGKY